MDDPYTFTARIVERWPDQLQIVPDDWPAFEAYTQTARIATDIHCHPESYVTVGVQQFVIRAHNADRVRYTIRPMNRANGRGIEALDLQSLD